MHSKCCLWFLRFAANHVFIIWVSISSFKYKHHYQSKVILAVVVKRKSCMCSGSKGRSSNLMCLHFLGLFFFSIFWVILLFRAFHIFGVVYISLLVFIFGHRYFGCCLQLYGFLPFWDFIWLFAHHHFCGYNSKNRGKPDFTGSNGAKQGKEGQMRTNRAKLGQTAPNGAKRAQTGSNRVKLGNT